MIVVQHDLKIALAWAFLQINSFTIKQEETYFWHDTLHHFIIENIERQSLSPSPQAENLVLFISCTNRKYREAVNYRSNFSTIAEAIC